MTSRYFSKHDRQWNVHIKSEGEIVKSDLKFRGNMLLIELGQLNYCESSHTEAKKFASVFTQQQQCAWLRFRMKHI
jgi:hypothetical protein